MSTTVIRKIIQFFTYNGKVHKLNIEEIKPLIKFFNSKYFNKYPETKWRYVVNQ